MHLLHTRKKHFLYLLKWLKKLWFEIIMLLSSLNWNLFGHEKKLLKVSMGPLRLQLLIYYLLKRIKTNIMENIMEKTKHYGKRPVPFTYCFESLSGQFFGTHFLVFLFGIVDQIGLSCFCRNNFPNFGA